MKLCEKTDPKLITRNNKSCVELSGEAPLIGHKGSSYQTKAAPSEPTMGGEITWSKRRKKTTHACKKNDRWMNNKESESMKHKGKGESRQSTKLMKTRQNPTASNRHGLLMKQFSAVGVFVFFFFF